MTGRITLVLSGGNALGACQGGACEALHRRDIRPNRIVASSIGAVNAAIIAGNPVDRGVEQPRRFWDEAAQDDLFWSTFGDTQKAEGGAGEVEASDGPAVMPPSRLLQTLNAKKGRRFRRPFHRRSAIRQDHGPSLIGGNPFQGKRHQPWCPTAGEMDDETRDHLLSVLNGERSYDFAAKADKTVAA